MGDNQLLVNSILLSINLFAFTFGVQFQFKCFFFLNALSRTMSVKFHSRRLSKL